MLSLRRNVEAPPGAMANLTPHCPLRDAYTGRHSGLAQVILQLLFVECIVVPPTR